MAALQPYIDPSPAREISHDRVKAKTIHEDHVDRRAMGQVTNYGTPMHSKDCGKLSSSIKKNFSSSSSKPKKIGDPIKMGSLVSSKTELADLKEENEYPPIEKMDPGEYFEETYEDILPMSHRAVNNYEQMKKHFSNPFYPPPCRSPSSEEKLNTWLGLFSDV